nr:hypothetical protein [Methylobacterium sp. 37f]
MQSPETKVTRVYTTRGRSRDEAAAHIGVGTTKFDALVASGRMPQPRTIDTRRVWCVYELDAAFDRLPVAGAPAEQTGSATDWSRMAA